MLYFSLRRSRQDRDALVCYWWSNERPDTFLVLCTSSLAQKHVVSLSLEIRRLVLEPVHRGCLAIINQLWQDGHWLLLVGIDYLQEVFLLLHLGQRGIMIILRGEWRLLE